MMTVLRRAAHGAIAGAAGTTAINAATYLDMAVRARPASETPQQAVDTIADRTGHPVPGEGEDRQNRLAGLGPLTGILTGVGIGVAAGLLRPVLARLPAPAAAAALGLAAMLATDGPVTALRLTDPRQWSPTDWASDVVPHLVYGGTTYVALLATAGPAASPPTRRRARAR